MATTTMYEYNPIRFNTTGLNAQDDIVTTQMKATLAADGWVSVYSDAAPNGLWTQYLYKRSRTVG